MTGLDTAAMVGFGGMICIIAAYAYLTWNPAPNPFLLHGTNLLGAALLTVSLLVHTNWPSLVLEGFWASIAIYGLVKAARERKSPSHLREEGVSPSSAAANPPSAGRGEQ